MKFPRLHALLAAALPAEEVPSLDTLGDVTREDLERLQGLFTRLGETLRVAERTAENVATLQETADAAGEVRAELGRRDELETVAASLVSAISGDAPPADRPARPGPGQMRPPAARVARRSTPAAATVRQRVTITAGGHREASDFGEIADQMSQVLRASQHNRKLERTVVASVTTEYPEERMLRSDAGINDTRLDAVRPGTPGGLVASGGICAPVAVDYSVPVWASAERPLRDALPRFGADRGGIVFTPPPDLGDVAGATGIWTEAIDVSPGEAVKAKLQVSCGSPTTVLVDAVSTSLVFGNMQGRFSPEWVAANTEEAFAAAARIAELNLWAKMLGAAGGLVTTAHLEGAARDLFELVDRAVQALRDRHRLADDKVIRLATGRWVKGLIRADFAKELANDSGRIGITDAEIDALFAARGVSPVWVMDPLPAKSTGTVQYPLQGFAAQSADVALNAWPTKAVLSFYAEGSYQFLDGGELNLGVVRDSTLNSTNDYETFVETFENVAYRGVEALHVVATVSPTGASSGTITPA